MLKWWLFVMLPKLPRRLSDDPAEHSDFEIGWNLQDGWRKLVEQYVRLHGSGTPSGQAQRLKRVRISVVFVKRMGDGEAIAVVRPNSGLDRLPDIALALLLGVRESLARKVDQTIRREDEDLISSAHLLIGCEFVDGFWRPFDAQRNYWGIESNTQDGIEEAIRQKLTVILRRLRFANTDVEEEIARSLPAKWSEIIESHYDLLVRDYWDSNRAEQFRSTKIEVVEAHMLSIDRAAAVVRTNVEVGELTDLALALLLGTREDLAREVHKSRSQLMELGEEVRQDRVLVWCLFEDGEWDIGGDPEENRAAEPETRAAIGEAVQLQTSWKEPPFSVTVLGPPEPIGDTLVRLPVRITSILPRWRISDIAFPGALLETDEDGDAKRVSWEIIDAKDRHDFPADLALIRGGSHEGILFFGSDESSLPYRPFTELHYLDETEQIVMVELDRSVKAPERIPFQEGSLGTIRGDPPVDGVSERLRGSQWANTPVPTVAKVGDTVEVFASTGYGMEPSYVLTVLGSPEALDERTLRLRLRITSREAELQAMELCFQLSPLPDKFGRLHFLWESVRWYEEMSDLSDSLRDVKLRMGETHEAFVYFRVPDGRPVLAPESLAILWYGPAMFELPIVL